MEHDCIIITLGKAAIKDHPGGWRAIIKEWKMADGESGGFWIYKCGTAPKHWDKINYVYWVVGGKIRARSRLVDVRKDLTIDFGDGRELYGKRWLVLCDFEMFPMGERFGMKGFRGFRYFNDSGFVN